MTSLPGMDLWELLFALLRDHTLELIGNVFQVTVVFVAFSIIENITPAVGGLGFKPRLRNFWIFLVCDILLAPLLMLLFIKLTVAVLSLAGGGQWIRIDLAGIAARFSGVAKPVAVGFLALIPILVYDFFFYWWHRTQHTNRWLWELHKLHHTDGNMNITTTKRQHFLEEPLKALFIGVPLTLFFSFTPVEAVLVTRLSGVWQFFIHANVNWRFGPLTLILCGPQFHRIHHSTEPEHLNRNFAVWFPIWDVLFGTHYTPKKDEFPRTGVAGSAANPSWREILLGPFDAWWRMARINPVSNPRRETSE